MKAVDEAPGGCSRLGSHPQCLLVSLKLQQCGTLPAMHVLMQGCNLAGNGHRWGAKYARHAPPTWRQSPANIEAPKAPFNARSHGDCHNNGHRSIATRPAHLIAVLIAHRSERSPWRAQPLQWRWWPARTAAGGCWRGDSSLPAVVGHLGRRWCLAAGPPHWAGAPWTRSCTSRATGAAGGGGGGGAEEGGKLFAPCRRRRRRCRLCSFRTEGILSPPTPTCSLPAT